MWCLGFSRLNVVRGDWIKVSLLIIKSDRKNTAVKFVSTGYFATSR